MKMKEFIKELQLLRPELQEKEVKVQAPNGLYLTPYVKMKLADGAIPIGFSMDDIEFMVITSE